MDEKTYPFKKWNPGRTTGTALILVLAGALGTYQALTHTQGTTVASLPLTIGQATVFYWAMAGLGYTIALVILVMGMLRAPLKQALTLGPDRLNLPKGPFSKESTEVPYASIRKMDVTTISTGYATVRRLNIHHAKGVTYLPAAMLEDKSAFDEIQAYLQRVIPI